MRKAIILPALLLVACSNYSANLPSIKPYKMDIQQGNAVTSKMMLQLRPGMTKSQVRFVMGTPLIADSFHANRWDYFYQMRKEGKIIEQRRVILDFENEQLKSVRGDVVPAGSDDAQAGTTASKAPYTLKSTSDAPAKEKGMLDKLKFWGDDEPKPSPEAKPTPANKPAVPTPAKTTEPAAPAPKPVVKTAPAPEQVTAPEKEEKGLLDKLKFWKSDEPADAAQPAPAQKAAPVQKPAAVQQAAPVPEPRRVEVKPAAKAESVAQPTTRVEPKPMPKTEPKAVPKPAEDLPAEDDPSYFERMLEKIGF